ncbi:MAG: 1,4-dihydroxy-2-naphthoate polyprenyltransferase [Calditrichaeota bacterium]|nr:MAG: 1,4-dihydroxy-2-naphthoate polyprenyltransferase [Calditrichota bacterium]
MSQSKLHIWLLASRPKTLPAAAAPVIIGTAFAWNAEAFHLLSFLGALLGALFIQIGTNLANDYFDYKKGSDREDRLGPTRVTQAGLVSPQSVKWAMIIAFSLAFLVGIYLVYRGGIPIVVIGLLSILFGVLYTGGRYPIGYIGLGDIFVLIFFGPVAVGGTYYVQTLSITNEVLIAGLAPGFFSVAILVVNNLRDINSDRQSGKKTLAVRFGERFSKIQYSLSLLIPFMIVIYLAVTNQNYNLLLPLVELVPVFFVLKNLLTQVGEPLNTVLAQTGMLLFFYSIFLSIGILL